MYLNNRTRCPDDILEKLMVAAGRAVGAKTTKAWVNVNMSKTNRTRGTAEDVSRCRRLRGKKNGRLRRSRWASVAGAFNLTIPNPDYVKPEDVGKHAEIIFNLVMHEFAHVREYQIGRHKFEWSHRQNGRRPKWKRRPEEIRAEDTVYEAMLKIEKGKIKDPKPLVQALADWYASQMNEKTNIWLRHRKVKEDYNEAKSQDDQVPQERMQAAV